MGAKRIEFSDTELPFVRSIWLKVVRVIVPSFVRSIWLNLTSAEESLVVVLTMLAVIGLESDFFIC